jgi:3-oxoacyl-[acyl-carrier protein] reductase
MEQQLVLVTGASRGIGASIADTMAAQGYVVVGTATTESGASRITERLRTVESHSQGVVCDVTSTESVATLFSHISEQFGKGPDILINNAAITADDLLLRLSEEKWNAVINTNLHALYRVTKAALRPMLKAKWGRIINIASVVAVSGNPGQTNYCAAKAGMIGMTKSLAQELASDSRNITVNAVAPGFIETDMTEQLTDEQRQQIFAKIPMKKLGKPSDVAAVVAFLAQEQASYITGQTIHVNGGMLMV